jgi:hypothetical protein
VLDYLKLLIVMCLQTNCPFYGEHVPHRLISQMAKYTCGKCQFVIGPIVQESGEEHGVIGSCPDCQTIFRNYQRITIQA